MPVFNRVVIVGLGLMGGSLGLALKRKRLARRVIGLSRSRATIRHAIRRGAIDAGTTVPAEAVRDADLVILATPVDLIARQGAALARRMKRGSVLTDLGSTKAEIVRRLDVAVPKGVSFVGSHPLAGSERRGLAAAQADLYEGTTCVITKTSRTNPGASARMARLWRGLGSRVVTLSPSTHDELLAQVSHLPHVLAFALTRSAGAKAQRVAPRSFLEMTRIAKSDPRLWDAILLSNRRALLAAMARFEREWRQARAALTRANAAGLRRWLTQAQRQRERLDA